MTCPFRDIALLGGDPRGVGQVFVARSFSGGAVIADGLGSSALLGDIQLLVAAGLLAPVASIAGLDQQ
jgi:hypothetical protein